MKHLIFAAFFIFALSESILSEEVDIFKTFQLKFRKTYRNQAEETHRLHIFKANLNLIEKHNALYEQRLVSYKQGINKFTDMTEAELKSMLTLSVSDKSNVYVTQHVKTGLPIPAAVDWRTQGQVTEVKDQGSCGSCWAFSVAGSTEAAYFRKSGNLVSLSTQQMVDCSTDFNYGCMGGYIDKTFEYVQTYGLESEDDYPYIGVSDFCKYSSSEVVTNITSFKVMTPEDEDALLDAVANVGPVSITMDALFMYPYTSGIYKDDRCIKERPDHAVLIVGYGSEDGQDFWIVKNSWGTSWGEEGYFRISRGTNECGVAEDGVYPTC